MQTVTTAVPMATAVTVAAVDTIRTHVVANRPTNIVRTIRAIAIVLIVFKNTLS